MPLGYTTSDSAVTIIEATFLGLSMGWWVIILLAAISGLSAQVWDQSKRIDRLEELIEDGEAEDEE